MTITIPSFTLKNFGLYAITGLLTAVLTFGLAWVVLPTPAPTPIVPVGATPREGALGFGLVPDPNTVPKPLPAVPGDDGDGSRQAAIVRSSTSTSCAPCGGERPRLDAKPQPLPTDEVQYEA